MFFQTWLLIEFDGLIDSEALQMWQIFGAVQFFKVRSCHTGCRWYMWTSRKISFLWNCTWPFVAWQNPKGDYDMISSLKVPQALCFSMSEVGSGGRWSFEVDEDHWQNRRNFNWKLEDLPLDLQPRNQKLLKFTAILPLPRCLSKLHSTEWSCGNWKLVGKPSPSFATLQSKWWKNTSFSLKLRCHIFSTSRGLKLEIPSKNSIQTLKQTIKPSNNFSALHPFRTAWLAAQKMPKYFWLGRCPRTRLGWLGHKETMGLASHSRISGVSPDDMQRPGWLIASEKKRPGWKVSSCRCQALMIRM